MMQDQYSGLTRTYTTAPERALSEIAYRADKLHDVYMTIAHALKQTAWGCEADPAINTLFETSNDLYDFVQELKTLHKTVDKGADDE